MWVIDSHTGGQPTRVIVEGGPDLGRGSLCARRRRFQQDCDVYRKRCVLEPKCSDAMVGALLCEPHDPQCSAGVIFFNAAGYLGMCGHGLMGLMVTLRHLGGIEPGRHMIETPVGNVRAELLADNEVCVENVESFRTRKGLVVETTDYGAFTGDIAWGGNWFFLARNAPADIDIANRFALTHAAFQIRSSLNDAGVTGDDGGEIDHIEFFQPSLSGGVDSKNFVLCPSGAYDRSPCGTGTSAKLACLAADGDLKPGDVWVQESLVGSRFKGSFEKAETPDRIIPFISGGAHVFAETRLILGKSDPFVEGIA